MADTADLPSVAKAFDWEAFRKNAHETIDFIVDYQIKLQQREYAVQSTVKPGYLAKMLPAEAPEDGCEWSDVMADVRQAVLPGITHWAHPDFFAFFPAMISPPALLGDLIANSFNQPGFNWVCSPAATEIEMLTMDWLAKAFGLPCSMLWSGSGGGVMQPTATEAMIVTALAARTRILRTTSTASASKLVAYYSDQSHFMIEKTCRVLSIPYVRKIPSVVGIPDEGDNFGNKPIDMAALKKQILSDIEEGLSPFYISVNFGATGICATDPLEEVAALCKQHTIWFNVDAAYAGVVAMCPEYRPMLNGIEHCDSLLINGSKWFSTLFNTNFMWFQQKEDVVASLNATGAYLKNDQTDGGAVVDLKDYHLGLGRPFRSLKMYCTLKQFGLNGMRASLRRHTLLAKQLAQRIQAIPDLQLVRVAFGLVCFRLADTYSNEQNLALLKLLNDSYSMFLVNTISDERVVLRISLASPYLALEDIVTLSEKLSAATGQLLTAAKQ